MAFKDDLKRSLGGPLFDVELEEQTDPGTDDDYKYIERRVIRRLNNYIPNSVCLVKTSIPVGSSGSVDLAGDDIFMVSNVYVVGRREQMSPEAAASWNLLYTQSYQYNILWPSEFMVADYSLYKNQLYNMRKVYGSSFEWKFDQAENKIYLQSVPSWATGIGVEGYKLLTSLDTDLNINWIGYDVALTYAEGMAMEMIGLKYDKYKHSGLELPGADYLSRGKEKMEKAVEDMVDMVIWPGGLSS